MSDITLGAKKISHVLFLEDIRGGWRRKIILAWGRGSGRPGLIAAFGSAVLPAARHLISWYVMCSLRVPNELTQVIPCSWCMAQRRYELISLVTIHSERLISAIWCENIY